MSLKIVGIYGKSGGGKSTAAKYLCKNLDNAKILEVDNIHMDYLLTCQREKLINLFGKDIIVNGKLNTIHFISFPEKQKIIFDETFDDLETILLKKIEDIKETCDWVIIDFFRLVSLKKIWNLCHYRILIEAINDDIRYENIVMRYKKNGRNITRTMEEEFMLRDYFVRDYYKYKHDFYLLNTYDNNFKKELDIIIKKLNN